MSRDGEATLAVVEVPLARIAALEADNRALRASLDDLVRAQAVNRTGSWRMDGANERLTWSDGFRWIFGLRAGDAPGAYESLFPLMHPEDRERVEHSWRAALQGMRFDIEHRIVIAGRVKWIRQKAVLEFDERANLLGGFGTVQDVTERKRIESALRENEERLSEFVEGAPVGIAMFDRDMRYLAVSRRYRDDYFTGEGDLIGRRHYELFPDTPERWQQVHRRCLAGETLRCEEDCVERPGGPTTWLRWEVRPWFAASGEVGGIILFTENITERKEAEQALMASKAEAERANNAKSRFLAAASHDLRQPLAALSLYVDVLGARLSAYDAPLLANMKACVAGLSEMLNDLLDLSKLAAGVVQPEPRGFAIADVLNNVLSTHAPEAQQKGVKLGCRVGDQIGHTDPVLFRRMVGNLVSNAIRYTERGGVLVAFRRRLGKTWVEVWDSGIGIPPEKQSEIFEEFKQLGNNERSRERGSGLGLAIVARTAGLLGLEIRVNSRPGRGSMFAVEIPLGAALPAPVCREHAHRPLRVAFVDDDPHVLDATVQALRENGHQVVAAPTAALVVQRLERTAPDIVVSDYRLAGGETGFDVITAVRNVFGTTLPALVVTGDTDPELMRAMSDRQVCVAHKPLDSGALEQVIARLVPVSSPEPARTGSS